MIGRVVYHVLLALASAAAAPIPLLGIIVMAVFGNLGKTLYFMVVAWMIEILVVGMLVDKELIFQWINVSKDCWVLFLIVLALLLAIFDREGFELPWKPSY